MALFNFGKKKEEEKKPCCCESATPVKAESLCCCGGAKEESVSTCTCGCGCSPNGLNIKVLGSGCKTCHALFENVNEAVTTAGIRAEVEYVTDMEQVMAYGVMSMPALVVNEKVVSMGKLLSAKDAEMLLHKLGF